MSTTTNSIEVVVRRRGALDTVCINDGDYVPEYKLYQGDRRSRQIAKRHWYRRRISGWNSGGSGWDKTTVKAPGKKETHVSRPEYWSM